MDPYLEHPAIWPDVHNSLMIILRDTLTPLLRPRYYASIEERTYIVDTFGPPAFAGRPDVAVVRPSPGAPPLAPLENIALVEPKSVQLPLPDEVRETYLEIREPVSGQVITVIEIRSPTNKHTGEGRRLYEEKRLRLLGTLTHLVEIDLLRDGEPMPVYDNGHQSDYRILVSRSYRRPAADLYTFSLRQPIPAFPLPLRRGEAEPTIDLNTLLHELYDRAAYDLRLNYKTDPVPPLAPPDALWADSLLHACGLRQP